MNAEEKQNIHIRLRDALEEEQISQRKAQDHLGINQGYISMIKLGNNLKAVPDKIWDRIKPWYESKKPIIAFENGVFVHRGMVVEVKSVEEFIDKAEEDLEQAQREEDLKVDDDQTPILFDEDADDLRTALHKIGSVIRSADGTEFYFLPLWFKIVGDQPMEIMGVDKLPWEIRMILKTMNPV